MSTSKEKLCAQKFALLFAGETKWTRHMVDSRELAYLLECRDNLAFALAKIRQLEEVLSNPCQVVAKRRAKRKH